MIKIICVGKIKEDFYKDALKEYLKRLSKYHKLEVYEVSDVDAKTKELVLEKEKENILKVLKEKDYLITLEIEGKKMNSVTFSNHLMNQLSLHSTITFLIGGSYGIHDDLKKRSNESLSFSDFTFPHQLFRVLLLEQIYRAFRISNGESYHK